MKTEGYLGCCNWRQEGILIKTAIQMCTSTLSAINENSIYLCSAQSYATTSISASQRWNIPLWFTKECQAAVDWMPKWRFATVASFRESCDVLWRHHQTGRRRKVQHMKELREEDASAATPAKPPSVFLSPTTAEAQPSRVVLWLFAEGSSRDGTSKTDWTRLWPLATRLEEVTPLGWSDQGCAVLARGCVFCLVKAEREN